MGAYAARREEKALARLCIGEVADPEILAGGARPSVFLGWDLQRRARAMWRCGGGHIVAG
ncbi:hypothetical protein ACIGT4_14095 [Streptomyces sioyaensis]|uniref:hypothetical protein n=1 Tax=Streptomyces sioyaensis TaxID=67364 RepID=UPI0037D87F4C